MNESAKNNNNNPPSKNVAKLFIFLSLNLKTYITYVLMMNN